jgi:hypothetical protein
MPLRFMAAGGAAGLSLAGVLLRLRCEKCGERPMRVSLEEDAGARAPGGMGATGGERRSAAKTPSGTPASVAIVREASESWRVTGKALHTSSKAG